MINFADLLNKYRQLTPPDSHLKSVVIETIHQYVGVEVKPNQIKFKGKNVFIQASPIIKSEILLKQNLIIKKLNSELQGLSPTAIR
jgi:hypothetical protein